MPVFWRGDNGGYAVTPRRLPWESRLDVAAWCRVVVAEMGRSGVSKTDLDQLYRWNLVVCWIWMIRIVFEFWMLGEEDEINFGYQEGIWVCGLELKERTELGLTV